MKKKTRRSEAKYPALDPHLNLKTRSDLLDMDYIESLSEKDKQWLNDFLTESVNADFKTNVDEGRKRIHKKKKVEHEKNKLLKKLLAELKTDVKQYINYLKMDREHMEENRTICFGLYKTRIKDSNIPANSKSKIKRLLNETNRTLKTNIKNQFNKLTDLCNLELKELNVLIEGEFKFIEDFYKKDAQDSNNSRNRCVLSRAKSQGRAASIDLIPETYLEKTSFEDAMILKIDSERENQD